MQKKKCLFIALVFTVLPALTVFSNDPSISTGLGMDFFFSRTAEAFLTTSAAFNIPAGRDMEVALGAEFALWPRKNTDDETIIEPVFFIPINAGVQFVFSRRIPHFLIGMGLCPVFIIFPDADPLSSEEPLRFYAGPYLKAGLRIPVHEVMSWFIELQQDLAIGKPNWINTATHIVTGINFKVASSDTREKPAGAKSGAGKK